MSRLGVILIGGILATIVGGQIGAIGGSELSKTSALPAPDAVDQGVIRAKMKDTASQATATGGYTRSEYRETYNELGSAAFAKLNVLEPGALYAVAESKNCDVVEESGLSDRASRKTLRWYVDCKNGNRFMVDQKQAQDALTRERAGHLQVTELAASCTAESLPMCDASEAQKKADQAIIVTYCGTLLDKALISSKGAKTAWSWDYRLGKGDTVVVEQDFSAPNAFGAELKARYHCEVNAASQRITKFVIDGPTGTQRIL